MLAHRLTLESEPVAVVDQPIEDRICDGRILEVSVPLLDRELARDQGGLAVVAIVEDLQQVSTDRIGQWGESEVVDDDEIGFGELAQERRLVLQRGVTGELVDEPRKPEAADAVVGAASGMADGARDVTADTGGSGDEDVEVLGDPLESGDLTQAGAIETAGGLEVDVLDGRFLGELGPAQSLTQPTGLTLDDLVLDEKAQALIEGQLVGLGARELFPPQRSNPSILGKSMSETRQ